MLSVIRTSEMHEYHKIKNAVVEILVPQGFEEISPDKEIDYYGSLMCIYAKSEKRFMIQWDGEEGYGAVERWLGNNSWEMLSPLVVENTDALFNDQLQQLCSTIKELL
jgi:hypothetical protein